MGRRRRTGVALGLAIPEPRGLDNGNSARESNDVDIFRSPARCHRGQRGGSGWKRKRGGHPQGNRFPVRTPEQQKFRFELAKGFRSLISNGGSGKVPLYFRFTIYNLRDDLNRRWFRKSKI